jgi:hypothetical protein
MWPTLVPLAPRRQPSGSTFGACGAPVQLSTAEHAPGEKLFVDYSGYRIAIIDAQIGESATPSLGHAP